MTVGTLDQWRRKAFVDFIKRGEASPPYPAWGL